MDNVPIKINTEEYRDFPSFYMATMDYFHSKTGANILTWPTEFTEWLSEEWKKQRPND